MQLLDLFAGIGGFSLAAHWLGWETVAFVEKEPFCQKVLAKNFPDVPIHGDIFEFDGKQYTGSVDVISGGFPCQPVSAAGKRNGKADERYLFPQMLRVVAEARPNWVVAENVRGLLSIDDGKLFEEICASLEAIDYSVQTFCIPACSVNAPHRRDRLWIIAQSGSVRCNDGGHHREERHIQTNQRTAPESQSERQRRECWVSQAGAALADADEPRPQRRNGKELPERPDERASRPSSPSPRNAPVSRLPGWSGGTMGQPSPVTEFERPSGREVERDFRGVPHGVSRRVDRIKALGNAIVPQIAYEIFKAIEAAE